MKFFLLLEVAIAIFLLYLIIAKVVIPAIENRKAFKKTEREAQLEAAIMKQNQEAHERTLNQTLKKENRL